MRLGIPATVIYFAVDVDVMDYQVDSNILPYFKAVTGSLAGDYLVGIYASRNVCQRVINSGYAVSAFVSDMSTGFSGNLGYPLPRMWNYDQFTEIHDYHGGEWDLDRVAYSSRIPAVDRLLPAQPSTPGYGSMNLFDLVEQLENRFEELRTMKVIQRGHGGAPLLGPLMFRWTTCVRLDHLNAVGPPGSRNTVVQRRLFSGVMEGYSAGVWSHFRETIL